MQGLHGWPQPLSAASDPKTVSRADARRPPIGEHVRAAVRARVRMAAPINPIKQETDMAEQMLKGLKIAILATDGFEQSELMEPRKALAAAGASVTIVAPKAGALRGWNQKEWAKDDVRVDLTLDESDPKAFDALVLPGGVMNPDTLRTLPKAVAFVKAFFDADKPVGAICHGPWTVIESGAARGRRMTSWPSLKTDIENADASWVDEEVVVDRNLVTGRKPDDLPAFNREILKLFGRRGANAGQRDGAVA
jgi:protease I